MRESRRIKIQNLERQMIISRRVWNLVHNNIYDNMYTGIIINTDTQIKGDVQIKCINNISNPVWNNVIDKVSRTIMREIKK